MQDTNIYNYENVVLVTGKKPWKKKLIKLIVGVLILAILVAGSYALYSINERKQMHRDMQGIWIATAVDSNGNPFFFELDIEEEAMTIYTKYSTTDIGTIIGEYTYEVVGNDSIRIYDKYAYVECEIEITNGNNTLKLLPSVILNDGAYESWYRDTSIDNEEIL